MRQTIKEDLMKLATQKRTRIVFPEAGVDARTIKAIAKLKAADWCDILAVGDADAIKKLAEKEGVSLDGITIIDPETDSRLPQFVAFYQKRRAKENLTDEQATKVVKDPLNYGAILIATGDADGMTAGAYNATSSVLRSALKCIGTQKGIKTCSSFFIMVLPEGADYGKNGVLVYADCAVNPNPTNEQLADITISTADTAAKLLDMTARVAMLSFSTKGSSKHADIDKVTSALAMVKARRPDIIVDGELQADAALVESVSKFKCPDSPVAGKANILIFPDLDAGNISYKLTQRLGNAQAIGPVLQGLAKSVNDLSRGCSVEDIVNTTIITAAKANLLANMEEKK